MTKIIRSALVRYPAKAMFVLVEDVESYPDFLPWCRASRVLRRMDGGVIEAELEIARAGFQQSFATRNSSSDFREIRMQLLSGPFRRLEGVWQFMELRQDACKVTLDLEFELASRLVAAAFGGIFGQICDTMVGAFSERAKQVYGP